MFVDGQASKVPHLMLWSAGCYTATALFYSFKSGLQVRGWQQQQCWLQLLVNVELYAASSWLAWLCNVFRLQTFQGAAVPCRLHTHFSVHRSTYRRQHDLDTCCGLSATYMSVCCPQDFFAWRWRASLTLRLQQVYCSNVGAICPRSQTPLLQVDQSWVLKSQSA